MKTAHIIDHVTRDTSGTIGQILRREGFTCTNFASNADGVAEVDPLASDLLVVMGGNLGVYQADDYPFVYDELTLLEKRLASEKPILGICLGAQLIAKALGSEVFIGENGPETGWHDLEVTPEGQQTAARHFDKSETKVVQWHSDTFDLPKGAVRLARSQVYENQIYSYGRSVIATQCHPEVCPRKVEDWLVGDAGAVHKGELDIAKVRRDTIEYGDKLVTQTENFLLDWLSHVGLS